MSLPVAGATEGSERLLAVEGAGGLCVALSSVNSTLQVFGQVRLSPDGAGQMALS